MDEHTNIHEKAVSIFIDEVETKIGKPLTESQKQGLRNSGSLMFLEAMTMGFYFAKNDEDMEKWLQEIDGFTRNAQ